MSQATIASRQRMSTARCYLDPVRSRRNLRIETDALTEGAAARRQALHRRPLLASPASRTRRGRRARSW